MALIVCGTKIGSSSDNEKQVMDSDIGTDVFLKFEYGERR